MTDLITRLKSAALPGTRRHALDNEAADEIERLRACLFQMQEAAKSLAQQANDKDDMESSGWINRGNW